jgi:hypothetical protein
MSIKTIIETVEIAVGKLGHGESFWTGSDECKTHVRLSSQDPLLRARDGKVYSYFRGTLYEHDEDRVVHHMKISQVDE